MTTQWVDNIDKAVNALTYQIEQLKVKAESNIPSVMKLNKITTPVIANKQAMYAFKIGSTFYERDPETVEQVDNKLSQLIAQLVQEKLQVEKEHESNKAAIENNLAIHVKVKQIMKDLGIPNQWSRSYYKTANSRKQITETTSAGYLGDLTRNIPTSDDSDRMLRLIADAHTKFKSYADTLKQKIRAAQAEKDKEEKKKKEMITKARLQIKYGLNEYSDWSDVLEALDKKCKYFILARAGEETRGNWNEGFWKVENALDKFTAETEEDKEIVNEYTEILEDHRNGDCEDGRVFRDCEFSYGFLYGKVDADLMADYETLKEYYEIH